MTSSGSVALWGLEQAAVSKGMGACVPAAKALSQVLSVSMPPPLSSLHQGGWTSHVATQRSQKHKSRSYQAQNWHMSLQSYFIVKVVSIRTLRQKNGNEHHFPMRGGDQESPPREGWAPSCPSVYELAQEALTEAQLSARLVPGFLPQGSHPPTSHWTVYLSSWRPGHSGGVGSFFMR